VLGTECHRRQIGISIYLQLGATGMERLQDCLALTSRSQGHIDYFCCQKPAGVSWDWLLETYCDAHARLRESSRHLLCFAS
jgi:hypothetical protein